MYLERSDIEFLKVSLMDGVKPTDVRSLISHIDSLEKHLDKLDDFFEDGWRQAIQQDELDERTDKIDGISNKDKE